MKIVMKTVEDSSPAASGGVPRFRTKSAAPSAVLPLAFTMSSFTFPGALRLK